jgi:hypothetical protein
MLNLLGVQARPNHKAIPPRFSFRAPHRFPCLALCLGLATSLYLPCPGYSQSMNVDPADVDAGKVQPLDLKPGCWQVRIESLAWVAPIPQQMTPDQVSQMEKAMPPEQLTEFKAVLKALQEGTLKVGNGTAENGQKVLSVSVSGGQQMACTASPFSVNGLEAYGSKTQKCERSVEESGGVRRIHVLCRGSEGVPQLLVDYQRIGEGYFIGTRVGTVDIWPTIVSFAGKWMSESATHLPLSPPPTDLDGKRPLGPLAVASVDGFRVVAMAEGKQIIAWIANNMLRCQSARMLKAYGPNPWNQFQQVYLHWSVANDAMNMMMGVQEPWKSQLAAEGLMNLTPQTVRFSNWAWGNVFSESNGNLAPDTIKLEDARERILWDAYFSRAKSEAEKQEMLRQVEKKYKVTLVDADFFQGPANP